MDKSLGECMFSFSLIKYVGVEFLGSVVGYMFNFEIVKLFSKVVVLFHILTNNVRVPVLHILAKT